MTESESANETERANRRVPSRGQIAAAKLMVKREREGKSTMELSPKVRAIAEKCK